MDFLSIAFFELNFVYEKTETKKAMGAWKPPMAFAFKSNHYSSTGQASLMFAQHHQLPCVILKISFTLILLSINIEFYLTNPPPLVKSFLSFLNFGDPTFHFSKVPGYSLASCLKRRSRSPR
jgi:hypothetical protein